LPRSIIVVLLSRRLLLPFLSSHRRGRRPPAGQLNNYSSNLGAVKHPWESEPASSTSN
jgi:hypothetical protein